MKQSPELPNWLSDMVVRLKQSHLTLSIDNFGQLNLSDTLKGFLIDILNSTNKDVFQAYNTQFLEDIIKLGPKEVEKICSVVEIVLHQPNQEKKETVVHQTVYHQYHIYAQTAPSGTQPIPSQDFLAVTTPTFFRQPDPQNGISTAAPVMTQHWHVPKQYKHFTGRSKQLAKLRKKLSTNSFCAITQTVTGEGGIGKTQLAKAFAYDSRNNNDPGKSYQLIWWFNGLGDVLESYRALADELDIDKDDKNVVELVKSKLCTMENWLLIFDDFPNPASVKNYLPNHTKNRGHVIITSRSIHWENTLKMTPFTPGEAIEYIVKETKIRDTEHMGELCKILGYFPLALSQAAAYIYRHRKKIAEYIHLITEHRKLLWEAENNLKGRQLPMPAYDDYQFTVQATIQLSLDALIVGSKAKDNTDARFALILLRYATILDSAKIPQAILQELILLSNTDGAQFNSEITMDLAVGELTSHSLIDRDFERDELDRKKLADTFSMHPLVHTILFDTMTSDEKINYGKQVLTILEKNIQGDLSDPVNWSRIAPLISHADRLLSLYLDTNELGIRDASSLRILLNSSIRYYSRVDLLGKMSNTLRQLESLVINYNLNDPNDAEHFIDTLIYRASQCTSQRTGVADQITRIDQHIEPLKRVLGAHRKCDELQFQLGILHIDIGNFKTGSDVLTQMLSTDYVQLSHSRRFICHANSGTAFQVMNNFDEAICHFEMALEVGQKYTEPNIGYICNALFAFYFDNHSENKHRYSLEKAECYCWESIKQSEKHKQQGRFGRYSGFAYCNLGSIYCRRGDFDQASGYHHNGVALLQTIVDNNHAGKWPIAWSQAIDKMQNNINEIKKNTAITLH